MEVDQGRARPGRDSRCAASTPRRDPPVVIDKEKAASRTRSTRGSRSPGVPALLRDDGHGPRGALARLIRPSGGPKPSSRGGIVRIKRLRGGRRGGPRRPRCSAFRSSSTCGRSCRPRRLVAGELAADHLGRLRPVEREAVVVAGGYDTTTVGKDAELSCASTDCRARRSTRYRVPTRSAGPRRRRPRAARQRGRWQRVLLETLWRHSAMFGSPRYGGIGMVALPFFVSSSDRPGGAESPGWRTASGSRWAGSTRRSRDPVRPRFHLRARALVRHAADRGARSPATRAGAICGG